MSGDYVYVCISYPKLYACIRIILHSLKYHITKASNRKKWLNTQGRMQRLDDLCLLLSTDIVRIPCLTAVDPNRKVPGLYFKVVDPKLQVADLKSEVGELRSGWIPTNLTTAEECSDTRRLHQTRPGIKSDHHGALITTVFVQKALYFYLSYCCNCLVSYR